MSGHSKWSTIKRQKGVTDQKRGQAFTKLSNAITLAVRQGGGIVDPSQNFKLRLSVDAARALNMPKENIERAIKRALGKEAGDLQEAVYEGFAPEGVSVIIEAATDNPARTTAQIKSIFNKAGGNFGQPGSVAYQFNQIGEIIVKKNGKTLDDAFALAAESGADDVEELDDEYCIYTSVINFAKVREDLEKAGLEIVDSSIARQPVAFISVSQEKSDKVISFLEQIEELDDVQKIYSNLEIN